MVLKGERDPRLIAFGNLLEDIRKDRARELRISLTQDAVAKAAEISLTHYGRIRRGESGTEYDTITRLIGALHLDADDARVSRLFRVVGLLPPNIVYEEIQTGPINAADGEKPDPPGTVRSEQNAPELEYESTYDVLVQAGLGELTGEPDAIDRVKRFVEFEVQEHQRRQTSFGKRPK